ncbi:hyaluronidase PH-20-like [Pholidichthys leucotaenia]
MENTQFEFLTADIMNYMCRHGGTSSGRVDNDMKSDSFAKMTPVRQAPFFSVFAMLTLLLPCGSSLMTDPPFLPGCHFTFTWNAPTELCDKHFGVPLDLSYFDLVSSTLKTATNQSISIFYIDRFGIFPYVDEDTGELFDKGVPQLVDLKDHREEAEDDIEYYIPADQPGLAVLDFEEWRPQWVRNWGSKDIYREISREIVRKRNESLSEDEVERQAKNGFERAARKYFIKSILIGKTLRPKRLWGYYLYPDCYNYGYNQDMDAFTGECPDIEKKRNSELLWLWNQTTVLYPSIYLELVLRDSKQARLFVRHRIKEAMRVSQLPNRTRAIPIYAYIRPVYKDSVDHYMSEFDLVNTIGEAAALGAAGVVSWGDMDVSDTEDSCLDARHHLDRVMNPYIFNVSMATRLCSKALCGDNGRCVRKRWNDDVFLHLDPHHYRIHRHGNRLTMSGGLSQDDIRWFDENFDCICYKKDQCRSLLTINIVPGAIITPENEGADWRNSLMTMAMFFCLRFALI